MKKTVLAVIVATASLSGAAQATNVDVNHFLDVAKNSANIGDSSAIYSGLNSRDKTIVDTAAPKAGISDEIMDQIHRADVRSQQPHFVSTPTEKVEAEENIKGSRVKRAIINGMERNEAINHGARFGGMTSQRDIADVKAEELAHTVAVNEKKAAEARLDNMKVDPNAEVVAAHDAQAYEVAQGVTRKADNVNRTSLQHVDGNTAAIADNTVDIDANAAGVAANKAGVAQTTAELNAVTYDIAGNRNAISSLATRAADTDARIAQTKAEQAKTNERVSANSAAIADHESRIESLESETTSKFSSLKNKVEENRKRASAGIAGVAAMANIPQVTDTQNFSVGAGVGNTDSESALAVGFSARATQNVVVKSSVSNDTQHNFVVGAGVSYGW